MTLTLFLSKALLCTAVQCWAALIGVNTPPPGEYQIILRMTDDPGYGGDVLQFHETEALAYSIHRPWLLRPEERRLERLKSSNPKSRTITQGCINVDEVVYNALVAEYMQANLTTLKIVP